MTQVSNPVVRGTQPDPSVVRIGPDYFMATSSFDLMPGIQMRHSTNLVDWHLLGAAVTRPEQYRRNGRPGPICLFAPTLRYHAGEFFLVCTNVAGGEGNFLLRATDPRDGWSDALWLDRDAFDPSLLFDGGRCYYTRRTMQRRSDGRLGPIVQAELDVDTGELGPFQDLTPHHGGFCSNDIEGPHLYRIADWYYLFCAEGGSWSGHMQTVARSRSPWGPFEPAPHNPVLTHRHRVGHPIQTLGHAELVDSVDGTWWALCLGTRHLGQGGFALHHNLGRETFLVPVEWSDGWPVLGDNGTIELDLVTSRNLPAPRVPHSGRSSLAQSGWRQIGNLLTGNPWLPDGEPISLRFGQSLDQLVEDRPTGALLVAQTEDLQKFSAAIESPPAGCSVGIGVYADRLHHYSLEVCTSTAGEGRVRFVQRIDSLLVVDEHPLPVAVMYTVWIEAGEREYTFGLATEATRAVIGSGSARLLSAETAEWFVGCHFALLAVGHSDSGATFSHVERKDLHDDRVARITTTGSALTGAG